MVPRMWMIPKYHCSITRTVMHHNIYLTDHITHISTLFSDYKPSRSIMLLVGCLLFLVCIPHVRDLNASYKSAYDGGSKSYWEQHIGFIKIVIILRNDVTVNCTWKGCGGYKESWISPFIFLLQMEWMGMIPVLWVCCNILSVGETPCQQKHG